MNNFENTACMFSLISLIVISGHFEEKAENQDSKYTKQAPDGMSGVWDIYTEYIQIGNITSGTTGDKELLFPKLEYWFI